MNGQLAIKDKLRQFKNDFSPKIFIWWGKVDSNNINEGLFIEQVLLYGNQNDWKLLKAIFSMKLIKKEWFGMLFNKSMYSRKLEIAKLFFGYPNPELYIKRMQNFHPANRAKPYQPKYMEIS